MIEPMILELVDGEGDPHGDMNVMVETLDDGRLMLHGPIRFVSESFARDATWTLRHAWEDRTKPTAAFRLPEVRETDPFSVVVINSVVLDAPPP